MLPELPVALAAGDGDPSRSKSRPDMLAAPACRIRQRAFFSFGMDVLLKLDLEETRQFFAAFFALSDRHWQGFLSARLSFLELIGFGLSLFAKSSNEARANLLLKGLPGLLGMLLGLLRTVGYQDRLLGKRQRQ